MLREWMKSMEEKGVKIIKRKRWIGFDEGELIIEKKDGKERVE